MVDNGAKVFVLAEKILSAQQGNALLGKSWKKATLQGKVLSKVANKRARLVKFHLLKQPIPVSTRILSLDENLVTVKGKRKLESSAFVLYSVFLCPIIACYRARQ